MQYKTTTVSPYMIDVPGREIGSGGSGIKIAKGRHARRAGNGPRISDFAFLVAGLAALTGMTLGMIMGIEQDFTLAPAHAHLNLLGWVTMALYGLYHRSIGRTGGWLGWVQVIAGALGALMMSGGLALYLPTDDHRFMPVVVAGSLIAFLGMALFVVILLVDLLGPGAPGSGDKVAA